MKLFIAALGLVLAAQAAPPNLVFILADDLRADAMGCAGNPVLQTPNLDRLAADGVRFANAFVTTPICCVSRASILTGQYARRHGVNDFRTPIRDLEATYPGLLKQAGYYIGFMGKWGTDDHNPAWFAKSARFFDWWAGEMIQARFWHEAACNYITNNGTSDRERFQCSCPKGANDEGVKGSGPDPLLRNPVHAETQFMPAKVAQFLDARDTAKPFCLSVSLKAPHAPWGGYAPRFAGEFETVDLPTRPSVTPEDALKQPAFARASLGGDWGVRAVKDLAFRLAEQRKYYRLVRGVDSFVGFVRDELARRGLASNTVIVFTGDNGHFLGEHGFGGKWFLHEESIRVPLIAFDPRAKGGTVVEQDALNIDIAPTLLELAGVPVPAPMQGSSFAPVLRGEPMKKRDGFFCEHLYGHHPQPPNHIERSEGWRSRDWKYIRWIDQTGDRREQMFDLSSDPYERTDLATDPAHARQLAELRATCAAAAESLR